MEDFANSAFTDGRSPTTFELQMLRDKVQRREIGIRLKRLRERSPFSQKVLAEKLSVTTRHYQNYENPGAGDFEVVERLAAIHWESWAKDDPEWGFVSSGWVWDGKDRRESADVLQALNGSSSKQLAQLGKQLDRIEERLAENQDGIIEILNHVDAGFALLDVSAAEPPSDQADRPSARGSASKGRTQRAR